MIRREVWEWPSNLPVGKQKLIFNYQMTFYCNTWTPNLLSKVISLISSRCTRSCMSSYFPQFFVLFLPFPTPATIGYHSHLLTRASTLFLFICPIHLSLAFLTLSNTKITPTLSQIFSFLILSLLVCPYIHLNILISTTFIF